MAKPKTIETVTASFPQISAIVVLVALSVWLGARFTPIAAIAENWFSDLRVALFSPDEPQNDEIILVTITEETLERLPYRSPVDRGFIADVLQSLAAKGVRAVGIDMLFDQVTEPDKDDLLQRTLQTYPVPLIAGIADGALSRDQKKFLKEYLDGVDTGFLNLAKDPADGVVRWIYPGRPTDGRFHFGLVGALALKLGRTPPAGLQPLRYFGDPLGDLKPFKTFPAHTIDLLPNAWFKDRVVLIGADLPMTDRHLTPYAVVAGPTAGLVHGVHLHAYGLAQVLEGRPAVPSNPWVAAVLILGLSLAGALIAGINIPLAGKLASGLFVLIFLGVAGVILYQAEIGMIPQAAPAAAFFLSLGVGTTYLHRKEWQQRKFLRQAFAQYVAPSVVNQLVDDPAGLSLSGKNRQMSFIFTDIANFTNFCETTKADQCVPLLNEYLDGLCSIVMAHDGTLDKITGDAINCFFNAPLDQPDHARRAVACALEMDAFGVRFSEQQQAKGIAFGITRIGVHSGPASVGNIGGRDRFNYTVYGDAVNASARLESVNKHLGTRVCVSGETAAACEDLSFRPVGTLVLKGKTEGLVALEPLTGEQASSPQVAAYRQAFDLLNKSDAGALGAFERLHADFPDDGLAAFHLGRLQAGEMDAVVHMTEK